MNILFLTENDIEKVVGGVERVTRILADDFRKEGHGVVCLSTSGKSVSSETFSKILKENRIDIIINQNLIDAHLKLLRPIPKGIKVFSVLHNRPFQHEGLGKIFKKISYPTTLKGRLMKLIGVYFPGFYIAQRRRASKKNLVRFLEVSDKLIVLCEDYKSRILRYMPDVNPSKIDFIHNPNTFEGCQLNSEKENLLLFVGRLENPQKNVTDFIDIWKEFHQGNPEWQAKIIGDGPHRKIFEAYARKKCVTDLEFLGSTNNIEEYYSRAKLLCMTSLYEGWPMVLPESIFLGCLPVLYNSFEAAPIIMGNAGSSCLVQPFEKESMVKTLSNFANYEPLRLSTLSKLQFNLRQFSLSGTDEGENVFWGKLLSFEKHGTSVKFSGNQDTEEITDI